jgi:nucleoside-triphosphatase THEP1
MVYMVSGRKNEGKTSRLRKLFSGITGGAGFVAEKVNDCGRVTTYNLVDLKTGEGRVLARLHSLPLPADWGEDFSHGAFRMSLGGFKWALGRLDSAIESGASAFFIDELGKVELDGRGHAELIRKALNTDMDLYITVRENNIEKAVGVFGIEDYKVIPAR